MRYHVRSTAGISWHLSVRNSTALQLMCLLCYSIVKVLVKASEINAGFCLNCIIDLSEKIPSFGNVCFVFREFLY